MVQLNGWFVPAGPFWFSQPPPWKPLNLPSTMNIKLQNTQIGDERKRFCQGLHQVPEASLNCGETVAASDILCGPVGGLVVGF